MKSMPFAISFAFNFNDSKNVSCSPGSGLGEALRPRLRGLASPRACGSLRDSRLAESSAGTETKGSEAAAAAVSLMNLHEQKERTPDWMIHTGLSNRKDQLILSLSNLKVHCF
ncbi:Hypothetical predicted protein [Podarcis lilfordi]|uniref:Uncharacterized protein n=1 Tax=Podarcis lilfordi TaxID=74358 RepID=A0AA35KUF3_9SAUR|nr:Hypothetical predicted protein [Podarcis lilfordi]